MAQYRTRECKFRGCHNLTRSKHGYCKDHEGYYLAKENAAKKAWKIKAGYKQPHNNTKTEKFYSSKQWQDLRRARLANDDFLCQECLKHNRITQATQVHHIKPILQNWDLRFDFENLESLCNVCHHEVRHHGKTWEEAHNDDD